MAIKIYHNDRNGNITLIFCHLEAMISSLSKVMGLQSRQKNDTYKHRLNEHDSTNRKDIQYDRSDDISHISYYY